MGEATATGPRIELVMMRDPDGETDVVVFIDGVEASAATGVTLDVTDIDPGRGHQMSEWLTSRKWAVETASPAAAEVIGQWYDANMGSSHIEDDRPWEIECDGEWGDGGVVYRYHVQRADRSRRVATGDEATMRAMFERLMHIATVTGVYGVSW